MGCWERFLEFLGLPKPSYGEFRTIYVNHKPLRSKQPLEHEERFPTNCVITSRYTILTFLPLNLLEQFSRMANFYFLIVAVVQLVSDTPVGPATSIVPLVFVLSVTAVKQAYEDLLRHRADDKVNNTPVQVIRNGCLQTLKAHEIRVGDVVRVVNNESFPCDLLLLSSCESNGECSITTANLDGETNLKVIESVAETKHLNSAAEIDHKLRAKISCEQPTTDLYKFKGSMQLAGREENVPLTAKNMLLRGAVLRNTDFVFGVTIYTGQQTKMQLNSQRGSPKKSVIEKRLDMFLLCFMLLMFIEAAFSTIMKWVYVVFNPGINGAWYLPPEAVTPWRVVEDLLGFIILYNYLIPISLYVTIELQKFLGSIFFEMDLGMFFEDPDTGERLPAKANTSDLNEELGQVQYLFSDKTGTLTENKMTFRLCCIDSESFRDVNGKLHRCSTGLACDVLDQQQREFFLVLALCHTIRVERSAQQQHQQQLQQQPQYTPEAAADYIYQASSPDEKAFVEACRNYGIIFHGTESGVSLVDVNGSMQKYKVLQILEFDSDRKRMSVILQREDGSYLLLTKGAESTMLERCSHGDRDAIVKYSADFAVEGLRVLVIAKRELSSQEFTRMNQQLLDASNDVMNREERTAEAFGCIEDELTALGCTAIEDELQTGVKETITDLRAAGIQVWILTGDKRETAENISLSAGHFTDAMSRIRIVEQDSADGCRSAVRLGVEEMAATADRNVEYCVVVDGQSLRYLVDAEEHAEAGELSLKSEFLALCQRTRAVLCCRCTPLQKARVVAMVKHGVQPKPVTCAVGDGANDVSMIREANVGIGLYGKEGRAAALNSDYALGRFHFLRRALLYHGHLYYVRLSTLVLYFFYKNVAFVTAAFLFAFFSGFSAASPYDAVFLTFYNVTVTSLPVLVYGLFEQHTRKSNLLQRPAIYRRIAHNSRLWWRELLNYCLSGLWHSLCCTFGVLAVLQAGQCIGSQHFMFDSFDFGGVVVQCVLICVTMRIVLKTFSFHVPVMVGIGVTLLGFIVLNVVYSSIQSPLLAENPYYYWAYFNQMQQPATWLLLLVIPGLALLPDLIVRVLEDNAVYIEEASCAADDLPEQQLHHANPLATNGASSNNNSSNISNNNKNVAGGTRATCYSNQGFNDSNLVAMSNKAGGNSSEATVQFSAVAGAQTGMDNAAFLAA